MGGRKTKGEGGEGGKENGEGEGRMGREEEEGCTTIEMREDDLRYNFFYL